MTNHQNKPKLVSYQVYGVLFTIISLIVLIIIFRFRSLADTMEQIVNPANATPAVDEIIPSNVSGSGDISLPSPGLVPNEGTTVNLYVRGTVSDANGFANLDHVTINVYRSGVSGGANCTPDNNDCYSATVEKNQLVAVGGNITLATFEVAIPVQYYADPTDAGSQYEDETWQVKATVADIENTTGTLTTNFETQSLASFALMRDGQPTTSIDYGTLSLGATSDQKYVTFRNTGNRKVDSYVHAADNFKSNLANFSDIPSTAVHVSLNDQFSYGTDDGSIQLTDSLLSLNLAQQTDDNTPTTRSAYFRLKMPASGVNGTYTNVTVFTAYAPLAAIPNPAPTLSSISPSSVASGGSDFTLTLTGTNFLANSQVQLNGSNRATTYVSATELTATILAADIATGGSSNITVVNPTPGGGTSNAKVLSNTLAWTERQPAGGISANWQSLASSADGQLIIAGTSFGGLYISTNGGSTWTQTLSDETSSAISTCVASSADGQRLIAGAEGGRLYISTNGGSSWTETQPAGEVDVAWRSVASSADGQRLIAGANGGRMYVSTNGGSTWTETRPFGDNDLYWILVSSSADGQRLIAGIDNGRLYISTNGGSSWTETQPAGSGNYQWKSAAFSADGMGLIVGNGSRLYISTNGGSTWTETRPAGDVNRDWTVASSADGQRLIAGANGGRMYVSTNGGSTWTETRPAGAVDLTWYALASSADGLHLVTANFDGGLYTSQ